MNAMKKNTGKKLPQKKAAPSSVRNTTPDTTAANTALDSTVYTDTSGSSSCHTDTSSSSSSGCDAGGF